MSNNVNTDILERASEMVEFWEGTVNAELIKMALDSNDLEQVRISTVNAEADASRQVMNGYNVLPSNDVTTENGVF